MCVVPLVFTRMHVLRRARRHLTKVQGTPSPTGAIATQHVCLRKMLVRGGAASGRHMKARQERARAAPAGALGVKEIITPAIPHDRSQMRRDCSSAIASALHHGACEGPGGLQPVAGLSRNMCEAIPPAVRAHDDVHHSCACLQ